MDEEKKRSCYGCGNYKAYYTKGFCHFDKEKFGYCTKRGEVINKHESCEHWRTSLHRSRLRKSIALKCLDETIIQIAVIKQILSEEQEENQHN